MGNINLQQLIQMLACNGNPGMVMQQMAQQNPIMQRAIQMGQNKSPQELALIAKNLAAQQGMDEAQFNMLLKQFGLQP